MKLFAALTLVASAMTVGATSSNVSALASCRDSNGAALGGSVYLYYNAPGAYCDVRPPQRLHLLRTPSRSACAAVGGHGWTTGNRICWDVNY